MAAILPPISFFYSITGKQLDSYIGLQKK